MYSPFLSSTHARIHTKRESLTLVCVSRHQPQKVPIVLVGSKLDLINERQVKREVAVQLSQSWGGVPYYETSSRKEINVRAIVSLSASALPQVRTNCIIAHTEMILRPYE